MRTKPLFTSWGVLAAGLAAVGTGHSDQIFTVTLSTTPLTATAAAPFSLAFQLTQGSQPNNNTAVIGALIYGVGGSAGPGCPAVLAPCASGGASGGISTTVSLSASSPFNSLIETFTPGSSLSFVVDLTSNLDAGGTPDAFAFSILDSGGGSIPTLDPSGADTLLTVNIGSTNPTILTYASDPSRNTLGGAGPSITMGAPVAQPAPLLQISKGHTGNFWQGQAGAAYVVTVSNQAAAGPTISPVTVTETLPSGLTLASMSGVGWNCSSNACTRSDSLSPGSSYSAITVDVNVNSNAPSPVTNQVRVSGGGSATVSASDLTSTMGACDFSGDGLPNVVDVQLIINEALGVAPAVNNLKGYGVVNVVDVQIEINAALGLGCAAVEG